MFRNQIIFTKTNMTCNKLKIKTCFLLVWIYWFYPSYNFRKSLIIRLKRD